MRSFPKVNPASLATPKGQPRSPFSYDRGHFIAHSAGGGLDVNLFPQLMIVNQRRSPAGNLYRDMEEFVSREENLGTFVYSRPIYNDQTWVPWKLEYGILKNDTTWMIHVFPNKIAMSTHALGIPMSP